MLSIGASSELIPLTPKQTRIDIQRGKIGRSPPPASMHDLANTDLFSLARADKIFRCLARQFLHQEFSIGAL